MINLEEAKNKAIGQLEAKLQEDIQKIQELERMISEANRTINNKTQTEEKLRAQIVEAAENQKISSSQLESNLTAKIKQLDAQNDKCYQEIDSLKSQNQNLLAQVKQLEQEIDQWRGKEQTLNQLNQECEMKISSLEKDIAALQSQCKTTEAESQKA